MTSTTSVRSSRRASHDGSLVSSPENVRGRVPEVLISLDPQGVNPRSKVALPRHQLVLALRDLPRVDTQPKRGDSILKHGFSGCRGQRLAVLPDLNVVGALERPDGQLNR